MDAKQALRWSLYYRGLSTLSALLGLALVAAGAVLGLGEAVSVATSGGDPTTALSPRSALLPAAFTVLGVAVWQIGKTAAFYKTLSEAVDQQMSERFDAEVVKSEILSVLDDRLAEMHTDVQQARRGVDRLTDDGHELGGDAQFEESDAPAAER